MGFTYKVYNPEGKYTAACADPTDAAAIVALHGEGTKIKADGRVVWTEGKELTTADNSYDTVAVVVLGRVRNNRIDQFRKYHRPDGCDLCVKYGIKEAS